MKRITFDFTDDTAAQLDEIREEAGMKNYGPLMSNALRLYRWYLTISKEGQELGVVKDGELIKTVEFIF